MIENVKKNLIYSFIYQGILVIAPLITTPYLSRVLGAYNIGIFSYTHSVIFYLALFAQLGTITYGVKVISRLRDNKYEMSKNFFEIWILTIISSIIVILLWCIILLFIKKYQIYHYVWTLWLLTVMCDVSWFFVGIEHFEHTVSRNCFFRIVGLISTFIFVKEKNDLKIYILIYILTYLLANISMWISLPKYLIKVKLSELKIFRHLKENIIYFLPTIISSIYVILDKSVLGFLIEDKRESGYYEQATKIIELAKTLTFVAINRVFEPKASYLVANNNYDELKNNMKTSLDFIFFMGFGFIFGFLGTVKNFVPVFFGEEFLKVKYLIIMLSPLCVIIGITTMLDQQYFIPKGKKKETNIYLIYGALLNFILNLFFIKYFASIGAVITTLLAEILVNILYFTHCENYIDISLIVKLGYKKIIAGIGMLLIINIIDYIFINYFQIKILYLLLLEIFFGGIGYIIILFILKDQILSFIKNLICIKK